MQHVSIKGSSDFVPQKKRIAVFDNDGTLWSEKPTYVQFVFMMDRIKVLALKHPEWKAKQPFKAVLEGSQKRIARFGKKEIDQLLIATHSGMSAKQFKKTVSDWITQAKHPRFNRPYTDLIYLPMLEVLNYFRANGFKTYIVSGGGRAFMRPWVGRVYGIPPQQVIGSTIKTRFVIHDGKPELRRLPDFGFISDNTGKPVAINNAIGQRPIAAFGNSDGDLAMLQWVAAGEGPHLCVLIHHTDPKREWAYDRRSKVGRLDKAMDEARRRGWLIVDMKRDWKVVYPFQHAGANNSTIQETIK